MSNYLYLVEEFDGVSYVGDDHLNLKNLSLYFDNKTDVLFLVDPEQKSNFTQAGSRSLVGLEICKKLKKSPAEQVPETEYFMLTKDECEKQKDDLLEMLSGLEEKALSNTNLSLSDVNYIKNSIDTELKDIKEQIHFAKQNPDPTRFNLSLHFSLAQFVQNDLDRFSSSSQPKLYHARNYFTRNDEYSFLYLAREGAAGIEFYPAVCKVNKQMGFGLTRNIDCSEEPRMLTSMPVAVLDKRLAKSDAFKPSFDSSNKVLGGLMSRGYRTYPDLAYFLHTDGVQDCSRF